MNIKFRIYKSLLIFFISLLIVGCATRSLYQIPPMTMMKSDHLFSATESQPLKTSKLVSISPKNNNSIDWRSVLLPMVYKMVAIDNIKHGSVLLVTTMKNSTNGSLQTDKATSVLTQLIKNNCNKFQLFSAEKLNIARQNLGLSADDKLELLSKKVGLARHLNAKYVLYSIASGDVKHPDLNLQLLLVRTGEIVWSIKNKNIF